MLKLEGVSKSYGKRHILGAIDLEVTDGEFFALLGPSGCGKSTLLKIIAGIVAPDAGKVRIAGVDATRLGARQRNCSMVFQNYALLPHLNVFENVAFPLVARAHAQEKDIFKRLSYLRGTLSSKLAKDEVHEVYAALKLVHLDAFVQAKVSTLSGGEAQRVALARALVTKPDLLLMDEPLANLDRQLKLGLREELKAIHKQTGITCIYVTHDQEEAVTLAGRIGLLNAGELVQVATAAEIVASPADAWVRDFFNKKNIVNPDLVKLLS